MSSRIDPLAGQPAPADRLVDVARLVTAYFTDRPDPGESAQRVAFGASGHRGSSLDLSFNEAHALAIAQAICPYRGEKNIAGPRYIGFYPQPLSPPAAAR